MKIALIYFSANLPESRKKHEINSDMLKHWSFFYKNSGSNLEPFLITDQNTKIPTFWDFPYVRIKEDSPICQKDILNKVGWLKMQSYKYIGHCLVLDLDAIIIRNIDELKHVTSPLTMSPYPISLSNRIEWPYWKFNAGTMIINSSIVEDKFRSLWFEREEFSHITYYDELIFTEICLSFGGVSIHPKYQAEWVGGDDLDLKKTYINKNNKILHFCGNEKKEQLKNFYKYILL